MSSLTGDFEQDKCSGRYDMEWSSLSAMQAWLLEEEELIVMELRLVNRQKNLTKSRGAWVRKVEYLCSRQGTGGLHEYIKKHPEWDRKVETKRVGCTCRLQVKIYPSSQTAPSAYHQPILSSIPAAAYPAGQPLHQAHHPQHLSHTQHHTIAPAYPHLLFQFPAPHMYAMPFAIPQYHDYPSVTFPNYPLPPLPGKHAHL